MPRKSKQKDTAADVCVRMTDDYSYRLDASNRRTLPKGWTGIVPAAVADAIETDGKGARDLPIEVVDATDGQEGAGDGATSKTAAKTEAGTTGATEVGATAGQAGSDLLGAQGSGES